MSVETYTHTKDNRIDETIRCDTKQEFDQIQMIIPQTFANFTYTVTHKVLKYGYRIRIKATRKTEKDVKPEMAVPVVEAQNDQHD